jgi:hypothetical protein
LREAEVCVKSRSTPAAATHGAAPTIEPLLLDEHQCAALCGVSFWTFREWTAAGLIPVVAPPSPLNPRRRIRRKLVDRRDVEKFIAEHKSSTGGRP